MLDVITLAAQQRILILDGAMGTMIQRHPMEEEHFRSELIKEKYRGIRPAPGYPACPDHTEKAALFKLLNVTENIGLELTESFAMTPAAAVSGWYFGHPDTKYFNTGKIAADQVESLANRKGMSVTELERWLTPILND